MLVHENLELCISSIPTPDQGSLYSSLTVNVCSFFTGYMNRVQKVNPKRVKLETFIESFETYFIVTSDVQSVVRLVNFEGRTSANIYRTQLGMHDGIDFW